MIWVMSDVHGCLDEFKELVEKKIKPTSKDTIYILGDLIDRGPKPLECVDYARSISNHISLGNHESLAVTNKDVWYNNGGLGTQADLDKRSKTYQKDFRYWIHELPVWFEVEVNGVKYLLIHAGMDCSNHAPGDSLEELLDRDRQNGEMDEDLRLWIREDFINYPALDSHITVFGHSYTGHIKSWNRPQIYFGRNYSTKLTGGKYDKIGIDCGCYRSGGTLAALCLDTMQEVYVKSKRDLYW